MLYFNICFYIKSLNNSVYEEQFTVQTVSVMDFPDWRRQIVPRLGWVFIEKDTKVTIPSLWQPSKINPCYTPGMFALRRKRRARDSIPGYKRARYYFRRKRMVSVLVKIFTQKYHEKKSRRIVSRSMPLWIISVFWPGIVFAIQMGKHTAKGLEAILGRFSHILYQSSEQETAAGQLARWISRGSWAHFHLLGEG